MKFQELFIFNPYHLADWPVGFWQPFLEAARTKVKEFLKTYKRLPVLRDRGFGSISNAISKGEYKSYGISTWNDLLFTTTGRTNKQGKDRKYEDEG